MAVDTIDTPENNNRHIKVVECDMNEIHFADKEGPVPRVREDLNICCKCGSILLSLFLQSVIIVERKL